ncbi:MAG: DJ-1/PfpI family protein [Balneolia bacterium]|nr:DJ-1/PfpI family protein [Balneolia bacterium]
MNMNMHDSAAPTHIAIFIYDDAEVLDFAGPFEVFATANRMAERLGMLSPFKTFLIGKTLGPVTARGGFRVMPSYAIDDHPSVDVLIVPGGLHEPQMARDDLREWIHKTHETSIVTTSVCTGAFILADAGVLDGRKVITHHEDREILQKEFPWCEVIDDNRKRFIDDGSVVTSAGVSAGIDMSLHLVERFGDKKLAKMTAENMAYEDCEL